MKTPAKSGAEEITFKCRFCGQPRPLSEMAVLMHYFPPLIACRECEQHMQALKREAEPQCTPEEQLPTM